ncbi:MAG TPA: hypothetical protein DEQ34_06540 [Balneolaceae bacterium]|nr:hypothetical protein [Balneolaceae bacterium]
MPKLFITLLLIVFLSGCAPEIKESHYFLDGYPQLKFRDPEMNPIPPELYIGNQLRNDVLIFEIKDPELTLYHDSKEEPYTGFIRTYYMDIYNIEARFKDGKIRRIRYWHPNRQLAMDADFVSGSGQAWTSTGALSVSWNKEEMFYLNPSTQKIRRIITDSLTSYFDLAGELEYYTKRLDSTYMQYYPNGTPRFMFPVNGNGSVKRWHPNGQIQVVGNYKDGEETGLWIEYDSTGAEVERRLWE